jgi:hypothetical protein
MAPTAGPNQGESRMSSRRPIASFGEGGMVKTLSSPRCLRQGLTRAGYVGCVYPKGSRALLFLADTCMKAIKISVAAKPKSRLRKLFGFVEGAPYSFCVTVENVGDEDVGAKAMDTDGRLTNLWAIEFVWRFPSGQGNVRRLPFPQKLAPGERHSFPEVDHSVLSAGYAMLHLRLYYVGTGLRLEIRDETGQVVALSDAIEQPYVPEVGKRAYTIALEPAFATFRAKSRGEVNQAIIIGIALAAFFTNVIVGILNLLK